MQGENRQKSGAYLFVCEHFLVIFNAAVGVSDDAITEFLCRVEVIILKNDNTYPQGAHAKNLHFRALLRPEITGRLEILRKTPI